MADRQWFDEAYKQVSQQVESSEDPHPERLAGYDALLRQLAELQRRSIFQGFSASHQQGCSSCRK